GISVDFFSSRYLDISVPSVRLPTLWIQVGIPLAGWVSPFGHLRINACCQLPGAFRRLPRPSSPLTAKASTVCALSLDPITPGRAPGIAPARSTRPTQPLSPIRPNVPFASAGPHRFFTSQVVKERHSTATSSSKNSCALHAVCGGASRDRTGDPLLAKQVRSQLSYGPNQTGIREGIT